VDAGLVNQRVGHGVETLGNPMQHDDMRNGHSGLVSNRFHELHQLGAHGA
jgi:hypothetical protein